MHASASINTPDADEVAPTSAIADASRILEQALDHALSMCLAVAKRLHTVLRPEDTRCVEAIPTLAPVVFEPSPLVRDLSQRRVQVDEVIARLETLLDRLDV